MRNELSQNIEELKKVFEDIQLVDPKITIKKDVIEILPLYWNFSFLTNFFPILCSIYVFTQNVELKIIIVFSLLTIAACYQIWVQLKLCNKIVINIQRKQLSISPNFLLKIIISQKIVQFKEVKEINYCSDNFRPAFRRYKIMIILKNTDTPIKLISTSEEDGAKKIVTALLHLL
jgi:hypothetical protein